MVKGELGNIFFIPRVLASVVEEPELETVGAGIFKVLMELIIESSFGFSSGFC